MAVSPYRYSISNQSGILTLVFEWIHPICFINFFANVKLTPAEGDEEETKENAQVSK